MPNLCFEARDQGGSRLVGGTVFGNLDVLDASDSNRAALTRSSQIELDRHAAQLAKVRARLDDPWRFGSGIAAVVVIVAA